MCTTLRRKVRLCRKGYKISQESQKDSLVDFEGYQSQSSIRLILFDSCPDFKKSEKGYVYSKEQEKCWLKASCSKAAYVKGVSDVASAEPGWFKNLMYGARLQDTNFRRTMVNSCNNGQVSVETMYWISF